MRVAYLASKVSVSKQNQRWLVLVAMVQVQATFNKFNMTGDKTGLVTQLKEVKPHLVVTCCLAHRTELAYKDVMKESKMYAKVLTLV